ncbi:MAG: GNAT family N-acetyltransferase [Planctomycetota bacterium]|jgi:GNAT superfamily N-acetyltransferase
MTLEIGEPVTGAGTLGDRILRRLPDWFGIEESTQMYVREMDDLPTFVATEDGDRRGFLTIKQHTPHAAEIFVMGVDPDFHRQGLGRALVMHAGAWLAGRGVSFLQVKTVGPSRDCDAYAQTRAFYQAVGFRPLEELPTLWNEANPCLILVKHLDPAAPAATDDDDDFLDQFERCTLPFDRWTHRSHVRVAYLYLRRHALPDAIDRMRAGVQAYNRAHDVPEGPNAGYHETVTQAWMRIINATMRAHGAAASADDFCNANPHLLRRSLLRAFFTRDRLLAPEAKSSFVEPDLAPLPRVP